jgi:hypothetical protein
MLGGAKYHEEFSALKPVQEFQARLVGRLDVQKNQVRGALFDDLVRLGSTRSRLDDLKIGAVFLDLSAHRLPCVQFIVHNHTPNLRFRIVYINFFDLWLKSKDNKNNPHRKIYTCKRLIHRRFQPWANSPRPMSIMR